MLNLSEDIRFEQLCQVNLNGFKASFRGIFLLLDEEEVEQLVKQNLPAREFAAKVLVDWVLGDVSNANGEPVPFSADALRALLKRPGVPMAVVNAFFKGYKPATEGNSDAPSAGS